MMASEKCVRSNQFDVRSMMMMILFCLFYPAGEAVRMAMWVVCAILTYEEGAVWIPKPLVGGLGIACAAVWQCRWGFVCLSFDMIVSKGGVLFCLGGAIRNQRLISYARLA